MHQIEMGKQYQTIDGRPVRVLCVDRDDTVYPVILLLHGCVYCADKYGRCGDNLQLVPTHEKRRLAGFLNIYDDGVVFYHPLREHADESKAMRQACIEIDIEYTVGEGLE